MAWPLHPTVDPHAESESWHVERVEGGVRVTGQLRTAEAAALIDGIRPATAGLEAPTIDLTGVDQLDGGVLALLRADLAARGVHGRLKIGDRYEALAQLYCAAPPLPPEPHPAEGFVEHLGRLAVQGATTFKSILGFTGETTVATGRLLHRPRSGHWGEIPYLVERAGSDALPIVILINFLLGFVLAYMAARALQMFGANIYVADLVAIGMARQLGPLMTAIIVCGRSGAGYATELGSMKVNEEIDALRTLGLEPHSWLVLPRVICLVIVLPVLTLVADLAGILGGLFVAATSLGLGARGYFNEIRSSLTSWDIASGLIMSVVFAIAIALIACEEGFVASGGPQGVGRRTTNTVVTCLFAIVLLDAGLTIIYRWFGKA